MVFHFLLRIFFLLSNFLLCFFLLDLLEFFALFFCLCGFLLGLLDFGIGGIDLLLGSFFSILYFLFSLGLSFLDFFVRLNIKLSFLNLFSFFLLFLFSILFLKVF